MKKKGRDRRLLHVASYGVYLRNLNKVANDPLVRAYILSSLISEESSCQNGGKHIAALPPAGTLSDPFALFAALSREFTVSLPDLPPTQARSRPPFYGPFMGEMRLRIYTALKTKSTQPLILTLIYVSILRIYGADARLSVCVENHPNETLSYEERRNIFDWQLQRQTCLRLRRSHAFNPVILFAEVWWDEIWTFVPVEFYSPFFHWHAGTRELPLLVAPPRLGRLKSVAELNPLYIRKFLEKLVTRLVPKQSTAAGAGGVGSSFLPMGIDLFNDVDDEDDDEDDDEEDIGGAEEADAAGTVSNAGETIERMRDRSSSPNSPSLFLRVRSIEDHISSRHEESITRSISLALSKTGAGMCPLLTDRFKTRMMCILNISSGGFLADSTDRYARSLPGGETKRFHRASRAACQIINNLLPDRKLENALALQHNDLDRLYLAKHLSALGSSIMPTSKTGFINSEYYTLQSTLKEDEVLLPDSKSIGFFRGEKVYDRKARVLKLRSSDEWIRRGRQIKNEEIVNPSKFLDKVKRVREPLSEHEREEGRKPRFTKVPYKLALYSFQQTVPIVSSEMVDALRNMPQSNYSDQTKGRFFFLKRSPIPHNWIHLSEKSYPKVVLTVKHLEIDYYTAISGFSYSAGSLTPVKDGVIVAGKDLDIIMMRQEKMERIMLKKEMSECLTSGRNWWRVLMKLIIARDSCVESGGSDTRKRLKVEDGCIRLP